MPTYKHTNRRDANDAELIEIARRYGVDYVQGLPGQGFDYIFFLPDRIVLIEIKPAGKYKLTEREKAVYDMVGLVAPGDYIVIQTADEMMELCAAR